MDKHTEDMWDYLIANGIGCVVKTPYGIGSIVDVDAGAAIWVEPLDENEEWETYQFECKELEQHRTRVLKQNWR